MLLYTEDAELRSVSSMDEQTSHSKIGHKLEQRQSFNNEGTHSAGMVRTEKGVRITNWLRQAIALMST